jgi:hypothetical protein
VGIGSLPRFGTPSDRKMLGCEWVGGILHPSFLILSCSIPPNLLLVPALAGSTTIPPHICVEVHGVRWRPTAVGDLQKPLREYGPPRPVAVNRRIPDGSLKIMVPPVRIRVPPLTETGVLQVKGP